MPDKPVPSIIGDRYSAARAKVQATSPRWKLRPWRVFQNIKSHDKPHSYPVDQSLMITVDYHPIAPLTVVAAATGFLFGMVGLWWVLDVLVLNRGG